MPSSSPVLLPESGRLADDEARFSTVFEAHYATVFRALRRVTRNDVEAEDLAQDTFVSLGWHRFTGERDHNLRAWLLRTALHRALNARRGERRRAGREARVGPLLVTEHAPDPDRMRVRARVRSVLLDLPDRTSQLLVLRAVGLSYAELAEVVDVAPGSVGTLLARAQRSFARTYAERFGALHEEEAP